MNGTWNKGHGSPVSKMTVTRLPPYIALIANKTAKKISYALL